MPLYRYKALNAHGEMLEGQMEAASDADVVTRLQEQGHLPVEAVPFAQRFVWQELEKLGAACRLREGFITDEGNHVIDADFGLIAEPASLARELNNITGLVAHGLFTGLADLVLMGKGDEVMRFVR